MNQGLGGIILEKSWFRRGPVAGYGGKILSVLSDMGNNVHTYIYVHTSVVVLLFFVYFA